MCNFTLGFHGCRSLMGFTSYFLKILILSLQIVGFIVWWLFSHCKFQKFPSFPCRYGRSRNAVPAIWEISIKFTHKVTTLVKVALDSVDISEITPKDPPVNHSICSNIHVAWPEWSIFKISQKFIFGVTFSKISLKALPVNQNLFLDTAYHVIRGWKQQQFTIF